MYIVQFGGYVLPSEQLEMSETQGSSRRGNRVTLPGMGGSFDLNGAGPDPLEEDTISKSFLLEAASESTLQTAIDAMVGELMLSQNDWRQGLRLLISQLPNGTRRGTWAKCSSVRWVMEYYHQRNGWIGSVGVTWARAWPVWWSYDDLLVLGDHHTLADTATYTFGQNVTSQAVSSSPTTFTITNNGNARVTFGIIEYEGQITNFKLQNLTNEHWLQYPGTLNNSGDRLTIKPGSFDVKVNGTRMGWSNLTVGTDRGQILPMVLEPGANQMRVTGSGTISGTVRYYWGEAWS